MHRSLRTRVLSTLSLALVTIALSGGNTLGAKPVATLRTAAVPAAVVHTAAADVSLSISNATELATPSVVGQSYTVKWQASVVPPGSGTPTGDVTVNGGSSCHADISVGQCSLTSTTAGVKHLSASYAGDGNFNGADSTVVDHTVDKASTATVVYADGDHGPYGQVFTLYSGVAAVAPGAGTPVGTIDFVDTTTGTVLCPAVRYDGSALATCNSSNLAVGRNTIRANFAGSTDFSASSGVLAFALFVARDATRVTMHTNPTSSVHGQAVRLVARVHFRTPAPGTPTGTLTFRRGRRVLCADVAIDSSGRATCGPITDLPTGADRLRVSYSGDALFRPSASPARIHDVTPAPTTTRVSATPDHAANGGTVTLSATVTTQAPGSGVPEGKVQFVIDGHRLAPQETLVDGHASLTITVSLPRGSHALRAFYVGAPDFAASSSPTMPLIVR